MRKQLLFITALSALFAADACATAVGFFPGFTSKRSVVNASGVALNDTNSLVMVGTLSAPTVFTINSQLSIASNITSVINLGGWKQFGYDTNTNTLNDGVTSTLGLNAGSNVSGQVTDNNFGETKADFFNGGKLLYLWVFNAPTVQAATQMGIFRATTAAAQWIFPTNTGFGENASFSTTSAASGAPVIAVIGNFGSTSSTTLQLTNSFSVTPVPDPSTFAFGLLTAVAACFSRKRRSNF